MNRLLLFAFALRRTLLFIVLAAAMMYPSWGQLAVTSDSVNYMSATENMAHFRGLHNFTGWTEKIHPAGYPALLVPGLWLGLTAEQSAFALTLLSLVVIGWMAWLLIRELSGWTDWRVTLGACLTMTSVPLLTYANFALSEPPFSALALVTAWVFVRLSKVGA